mgnify:CR=1 FL=1
MKKKLVLTAAVIAALSVGSCNSKKTNNQEADQDSLSYTEKDSLESNAFVLDSIAGTYEGTLPASVLSEATIRSRMNGRLTSTRFIPSDIVL